MWTGFSADVGEAVKPSWKLKSQAPKWAVMFSMETREKIIFMAKYGFL